MINQGKIANPEVTIAVVNIKSIARLFCFMSHSLYISSTCIDVGCSSPLSKVSLYIFSIMNGKDWYIDKGDMKITLLIKHLSY